MTINKLSRTTLPLLAAYLCFVGTCAWAGEPPTLQKLHDDLSLSTSQESAWESFSQAYKIAPGEMAQEREASEKMMSLTGPQRIDLAVTMAKGALARLESRAAALKAFYATLSPQQQHTFDRDTLSDSGP